MLPQPLYAALLHAVNSCLAAPVSGFQFQAVGGGSINPCFKISTPGHELFCKVNRIREFPGLFETERRGLQLLAAQQVIATPSIRLFAVEGAYQILLLEWIEPGGATASFWKLFGAQLAALHQKTAPQYGLDHDNYMGSVPQQNGQTADWIPFLVQQRLQPLVEKCRNENLLPAADIQMFENLYGKMDEFFPGKEPPSLLHGDLWSGNFICAASGKPYLIDPAVYYGHPAADLGMTTLFGGFNKSFYESYHYHFPLPPQHRDQWKVCNLYPLLIHLLLFGKSYLRSIHQTLREFAS